MVKEHGSRRTAETIWLTQGRPKTYPHELGPFILPRFHKNYKENHRKLVREIEKFLRFEEDLRMKALLYNDTYNRR